MRVAPHHQGTRPCWSGRCRILATHFPMRLRMPRHRMRKVVTATILVASVAILGCDRPEESVPQRPRIGTYNTDSLLKLYIALATVPDSMARATRHAYMCYSTTESMRYGGNAFNY